MKNIFLTIIFIQLFQCLFAFNNDDFLFQADSLEKYAKSVLFKNPASSEKAGTELIILSKNHHLTASLMSGYNIVGLSYYYLDNAEAGISYTAYPQQAS